MYAFKRRDVCRKKNEFSYLQGQISVTFIMEVSTFFRSGVSRGELRVASTLWGRRLRLLLTMCTQPLLPVSSDCFRVVDLP